MLEATENALSSNQISDDVREMLQKEHDSTDGHRSFIAYMNKERKTYTFGPKVQISLDGRRYLQLVQCYKLHLPEYAEVCHQYDKYKEEERLRHRVPESMGNWTPPSMLLDKYGDVLPGLLSGPPTVGDVVSKATLVDRQRGMLIHLRSAQKEDECVVRKAYSSFIQGEFVETEPPTDRHFIGTTPSGEEKFIYFGRIQYFLVQQFAGKTYELAYVDWFKPPFYEEEMKMWRVDQSLGLYKWLPYIFVSEIESQVVVAKDPDDTKNLWILSSV